MTTVEAVAGAADEELMQLAGVGKATATKLRKAARDLATA